MELYPHQLEQLQFMAQRMEAAAAVIGKAAEVNANVQGMLAENQMRERGGSAPAYGEAAFKEQADSILDVMKNNGVI